MSARAFRFRYTPEQWATIRSAVRRLGADADQTLTYEQVSDQPSGELHSASLRERLELIGTVYLLTRRYSAEHPVMTIGQTYTPLDLVMAACDCDLDTAFGFLADQVWPSSVSIDVEGILETQAKAIDEPANGTATARVEVLAEPKEI